MKKLSCVLLSFIFIVGCNSSSGGGGGKSDPNHPAKPGAETGEGNIPDSNGPANCDFNDVTIPEDIGQALPEGIDKTSPGGFRTRDCKTVVVAFSRSEQRFVVTRLIDGKPDTSFGEQGRKTIEFLKNISQTYGPIKFLRKDNRVYMIAASGARKSVGFALGSFDLDGEFLQEPFNNGAAYVSVWKAPNSGSWCSQFDLELSDVKSLNPQQLEVSGVFSTACESTTYPVTRVMNIEFPKIELKKELPKTCSDFNYSSPGAVNGSHHKFAASADCSRLTISYDWLYPPSTQETINTWTDGTCKTSDRFGYSCFYYENDYLVREYVNSFWQSGKSYLKVVKNRANICGVSSGVWERIMVESPYPPTDPKFYQLCTYY